MIALRVKMKIEKTETVEHHVELADGDFYADITFRDEKFYKLEVRCKGEEGFHMHNLKDVELNANILNKVLPYCKDRKHNG